nr:unnamed protein product [Callosobruchus analis]
MSTQVSQVILQTEKRLRTIYSLEQGSSNLSWQYSPAPMLFKFLSLFKMQMATSGCVDRSCNVVFLLIRLSGKLSRISYNAFQSVVFKVFSKSSSAVSRLSLELLLQASYSFYTWPSAPALAWFLWENRHELTGKRVLELGSGTALPGILAAKCNASVTLSDSATLPKSLAHIKRSCQLNSLVVGRDIKVVGLTWGLFLSDLDSLCPLDLILGSDCFFEPSTFEDILVTISYLLEKNPAAKFVHNINNLGSSAGLDIHDLVGNHSIHLLEITRKS